MLRAGITVISQVFVSFSGAPNLKAWRKHVKDNLDEEGIMFSYVMLGTNDLQRAGTGNGTMVALNAHSFEHIAQLHALALSLGGTDEGAPGHRPHYGAGFHSAYVRDPDGNKLAFVFYSNVGLTSN